MKIMKIVHMQEYESSSWDGSNSQMYMGEESWSVGENFNGEFVQGEVSLIVKESEGYTIWLMKENGKVAEAMWIPLHAVQRIYYGEE